VGSAPLAPRGPGSLAPAAPSAGERSRSARSHSANIGSTLADLDRPSQRAAGRALRAAPDAASEQRLIAKDSKVAAYTRNADTFSRGLRQRMALDPKGAEPYLQRGAAAQDAFDTSLRVGVGSALGCFYGPYWGYSNWYGPNWSWCGWGKSWNHWWWWSCWSGWYPYSNWCSPWGWNWGWGWPKSYCWWPSYSWWYWGPTYYASVIYHYSDPEPEVIVVQSDDPVQVIVQEGTLSTPGPQVVTGEAVSGGLSMQQKAQLDSILGTKTAQSEVDRLLGDGDQAFVEKRYVDAVRFYSKAIEFAPAQGRLYMILADALLATGDYHYGAYAIRRALQYDPSLADQQIDKHDFYATDPAEFDRHLAQLELFVRDHPADADARLMLATNYLYGKRPAAAVDLLQSREQAPTKLDEAEALVLAAAKRAQFGAK
jgi:tetratricopeptide (TPR) repeat protein